jgi:hypothetical protein
VPEGLSAGEVAHTMGHKHGHQQPVDRRTEVIEILEAIVLAIVAVATAWSGYQTARWDSKQAFLYGTSSSARFAGDRQATRGGQEQLYDAGTFGSWLAATATGNVKAAALFERRFRPEFRPAFRAWLKTDPFHNPKAPPGPLVMPQYHNASLIASAASATKAAAAFEEGTKAREHGDDYLRNTVLLATVLFLTALAGRFKTHAVRASLLGVSAVILVICLYYVVTYPRG